MVTDIPGHWDGHRHSNLPEVQNHGISKIQITENLEDTSWCSDSVQCFVHLTIVWLGWGYTNCWGRGVASVPGSLLKYGGIRVVWWLGVYPNPPPIFAKAGGVRLVQQEGLGTRLVFIHSIHPRRMFDFVMQPSSSRCHVKMGPQNFKFWGSRDPNHRWMGPPGALKIFWGPFWAPSHWMSIGKFEWLLYNAWLHVHEINVRKWTC